MAEEVPEPCSLRSTEVGRRGSGTNRLCAFESGLAKTRLTPDDITRMFGIGQHPLPPPQGSAFERFFCFSFLFFPFFSSLFFRF